jgi:hypothetical protein
VVDGRIRADLHVITKNDTHPDHRSCSHRAAATAFEPRAYDCSVSDHAVLPNRHAIDNDGPVRQDNVRSDGRTIREIAAIAEPEQRQISNPRIRIAREGQRSPIAEHSIQETAKQLAAQEQLVHYRQIVNGVPAQTVHPASEVLTIAKIANEPTGLDRALPG